MNARTTARRGLALAAIAAAGIIALTGCKIGGGKDAASGKTTPTPAAATPSASASASGKSGSTGSPKPSSSKKSGGNNALPDVCTLLSKAEVSALAGGKQVVQVDPDDAKPTDTTRFCQWQLSGARLAVFLSPTTASEFSQAHSQGRPVSGLGDAAYVDSNHLYVRHGNLQVDVFATNGDSDAAGEKMAKAAAAKVISRL